jgi:ketosteroid isomerase-like protein
MTTSQSTEIEARLARLEGRLQATEDREAIRELTGRYCQAVVRDDMAAIVAMFTDDGALETTFPPDSGQDHTTTRGTAELKEAYTRTAGMQLTPCVHNHVIELDGDEARGFCSLELRLVQDGRAYTAAGHYEDLYAREGDEWKFKVRHLVAYHWVPHTEGWA